MLPAIPPRNRTTVADQTVNQELPKHFQSTEVEQRWNAFWEEKQYFAADPEAPGEPYCISIPPPNVTGALHMGHGLDETIQDTLVRFHRMKGRNALWVPGTDHAGIATQHVVAEKLLREGRRRQDLGREAFLEEVWKWKDEHGNRIVNQLKRLGCSCDWNREAFTLDDTRANAVRVAFKQLYDKGLIYRGEYLVNWDPVSLTALSDDEVEYEEETGHLWHLRYPLEDGSGYVVVATTRPETMLGDTAVAVNPTDERWKHLIGKNVVLPLVDRKIPIIADDFVKKDFGSGLVKITPGHDPNDFLCGMRHELPMINVLTEDAKINDNGGKYEGLDRYEARKRVVEDFTALGLLDKIEEHVHRVGRGYRSKSIVEPRLSKQWFVKIKPLADKALAAVDNGDIRIIPESPYADIYRNWMTNVRDWCISRQLWWGHRIPIWYRKDDPETMVCWDGDGVPPEVAADPDAWYQDEDVLDTWFSSALWPASILGWPEQTADLKKWYPNNVLVTGHDILFFWVARMIMFGIELVGEKPFADVYLHGLIFGKSHYEKVGGDMKLIPPLEARKFEADGKLPKNVVAKWEKMSKSKGNVIDPLDVIDEFGTDALRLTVGAYAALGRNIDLDWTRFEGYRNFVNKLWNAARFVLMVTEPLSGDDFRRGIDSCELKREDRWILSRLSRTIKEATGYLERYEFDRYVNCLYHFTWGDYCDWYVELAKGRVYGENAGGESARAARTVLLTILEHISRLLHPVMPFGTEEIWQILRGRLANAEPGQATDWPATEGTFPATFDRPALAVARWPEIANTRTDDQAEADMALLQEAIGAIRNIRGEMRVPVEMKLDIRIRHNEPTAREVLDQEAGAIRSLASVSSCVVGAEVEEPRFASTFVSGGLTIYVELPSELIAQEKARLEKELAFSTKGLEQAQKKLANEKFVSNAAPEVVEKEREKLARLEADVAAMAERLAALG